MTLTTLRWAPLLNRLVCALVSTEALFAALWVGVLVLAVWL